MNHIKIKEKISTFFNNRDFLHIYIYKYPFPFRQTEIPEWRQKEIEDDVFRTGDSLFVWRLLEKACRRSLKTELNDLNPHKTPSGRLVIDGCYVSLSHSHRYYMVALSSQPVGVDIQHVRETNKMDLNSRCWSEDEKKLLDNESSPRNIMYWCRKEALYKLDDRNISFEDNRALFDVTEFEGFFLDGYLRDGGMHYSICSPLIRNGKKPVIFYNFKLNENDFGNGSD